MPSMSKQHFNIFLVQNLIQWFEERIDARTRYRFYSDDSDQLTNLIEALNSFKTGEIEYLETKLPYIAIGSVRLVYVNDVESVMNEHFISNLRDAVSLPHESFEGCALLVIHQSRLDTLMNSATDLAQTDAPLNANSIEEELQRLSKNSSKPTLYTTLLELQSKLIVSENRSAFGYKGIYESIINETIDFKALNLFRDKSLHNLNTKEKIKRQINENQKLYSDIEYNIANFANELPDHLTQFSPEFIEQHLSIDGWQDTTYQQLLEEIRKNQGETISFDERETITQERYFMRDESTTASGKRTKNIIVFANNDRVVLEFKFRGDGLKSENFTIMDNKALKTTPMHYRHRKLSLDIPFDGNPLYFRVRLQTKKSSETHFFKVLVINEGSFYIDDIKNSFIIQSKANEILLKLSSFDLHFAPTTTQDIYKLPIDTESIDITQFPSIDIEEFYDAHDEVKFAISNGNNELTLAIENEKLEDSITLPLLLNTKRFDHLFITKGNAQYSMTKKKAILDNREFLLVGHRNTYIEYEYQFSLYQIFQLDDGIGAEIEELQSIDAAIASSYQALLNYFSTHQTTPSLCAWDNEVYTLAKSFVDSTLEYLSNIPSNQALLSNHKKIFEIGFVRNKNRTFLSPFSPLVLAYILYLVESASKEEDKSYRNIFPITLKRFNAKGLFPYLFIDSDTYAYTKVVEEDQFWLEFVPSIDNELNYISKLTTEKIGEFKEAFSTLFEFRQDAPLIINSINNAQNEELFIGLVNYYKKNSDDPLKIVVNLYDEAFDETAFDRFADMDSNKTIAQKYRLKENADTIIDTMRTHISYSKHLLSEEQTYSHLSFFKNNEKVEIRDYDVKQKQSGLVYQGIISGESSEKSNTHYYSGFGLRDIDTDGLTHLQLAKIYNTMQRAIYEEGTFYDANKSIALMISENFKALLEKSYSNALWTVIIDPKVTLEFFDGYSDLILIHYSDQYSSSANYDAITVTAKSNLYSNIVGSKDIIREFNAFNGEWLIKMITQQEKIKKEKNGIIAAYKYMTALLDSPQITWVPLSVAEMIRVSGNIGLSMSKSDFSRHNERLVSSSVNFGAISDDILMVGFCDEGVILYPVEVKSGSADMTKAHQQAKALKTFFYEHLFSGDNFKTRVLKGLFIRQVFMQVEKYQLYDVFDTDYFDPLYAKREKLLDGCYSLVEFKDYAQGAVVAFLDIQLDTDIMIKDDILECKLPFDFQKSMLETSYAKLKTKIDNEEYGHISSHRPTSINCIATDEETQEAKPKNTQPITPQDEIEPTTPKAIETIEPLSIKFGINNHTKEDILWYPTDTTQTLNTNTGIIGTMGTGKTQFTKSLIAQMMQNSHHNVDALPIGILIFDYKGDYIKEDFTIPTNAKVLVPHNLPFNPLSLFGNRPLLPVHTTNLFKTTLAKAFGLGTVQQSNLNRIILEAYEKRGIRKGDKSTWSIPAPTIQNIWEIYSSEEKVTHDSLYASLEKLISFEIFEPNPDKTRSLYDLIDGITVINLSGYDADIQNLIVAITLDIFYTQMHIKGSSKHQGDYRQISKMVLVDEADNFMSQDFESLKKILKEGREFGVGTILSTQQLTHFKTSEDNYANYIQSWIVHQVSNIKIQDITSIFNISNKAEAEGLMEQIRKLEKHYSIYVDGNKNMTKMRDLAFWELMKAKS